MASSLRKNAVLESEDDDDVGSMFAKDELSDQNTSTIPNHNQESDEDYHFSMPSYVYPNGANLSATSIGKNNNKSRTIHNLDQQAASSTRLRNRSTSPYNDTITASRLNFSNSFNNGVSSDSESSDSGSPTPEFSTQMIGSIATSKVNSSFLPDILSTINSNLETSVSNDQFLPYFNTAGKGLTDGHYQGSGLKPVEVLCILENKEKLQIANLHANIDRQQQILSKGKSPSGIRMAITSNLADLLQVFQGFASFYQTDYQVRKKLISSFDVWEKKKAKIRHKIREIEDTISYNDKLQVLIDEHNSVSGEIETLEARLRVLKDKKQVLRQEIDSTKSVVESEKSSYERSIDNINKIEHKAIERLIKNKYVYYQQDLNGQGLDATSSIPLSKRNVVDNLKIAISRYSVTLKTSPQSEFNIDEINQTLQSQQRYARKFKKHYKQCTKDFEKSISVWQEVCEELAIRERKILSYLSEAQSHSRVNAQEKIESLLCESLDVLSKKLLLLETHLNKREEANVSEVFKNVLQNELDAAANALRLVSPGSGKIENGPARPHSLLTDQVAEAQNREVGVSLPASAFEKNGPSGDPGSVSSNDSKSMVSLNINDDNETSFARQKNGGLGRKVLSPGLSVERPMTPVLSIDSTPSGSPPTTSFVNTFASGLSGASSGGEGGNREHGGVPGSGASYRTSFLTSSLFPSRYKQGDRKAAKKD